MIFEKDIKAKQEQLQGLNSQNNYGRDRLLRPFYFCI